MIMVLGYWVLANTCRYRVVLVSAQYFFSNRDQYRADDSLQRRLTTHDDLIRRNSL